MKMENITPVNPDATQRILEINAKWWHWLNKKGGRRKLADSGVTYTDGHAIFYDSELMRRLGLNNDEAVKPAKPRLTYAEFLALRKAQQDATPVEAAIAAPESVAETRDAEPVAPVAPEIKPAVARPAQHRRKPVSVIKGAITKTRNTNARDLEFQECYAAAEEAGYTTGDEIAYFFNATGFFGPRGQPWTKKRVYAMNLSVKRRLELMERYGKNYVRRRSVEERKKLAEAKSS